MELLGILSFPPPLGLGRVGGYALAVTQPCNDWRIVVITHREAGWGVIRMFLRLPPTRPWLGFVLVPSCVHVLVGRGTMGLGRGSPRPPVAPGLSRCFPNCRRGMYVASHEEQLRIFRPPK